MNDPRATPAELRTRRIEGGGAVEIRLQTASIDFENAEDLVEKATRLLDDLLSEGHRAFVVDLGAVENLDSSGVGVLVQAHHRAAAVGGSLAFFGARPRVREMLRLMRLDRFLSLGEHREQALRRVLDPV